MNDEYIWFECSRENLGWIGIGRTLKYKIRINKIFGPPEDKEIIPEYRVLKALRRLEAKDNVHGNFRPIGYLDDQGNVLDYITEKNIIGILYTGVLKESLVNFINEL